MSWKFLLVRRVSELSRHPQKKNTDCEIVQSTARGSYVHTALNLGKGAISEFGKMTGSHGR